MREIWFFCSNMIFYLKFCCILIFEQLSGMHWWYKTASHSAELTAGFYNSSNRDGYAAIMAMLKRHSATLCFTCSEMSLTNQNTDLSEALADPEGLLWQVSISNSGFDIFPFMTNFFNKILILTFLTSIAFCFRNTHRCPNPVLTADCNLGSECCLGCQYISCQ